MGNYVNIVVVVPPRMATRLVELEGTHHPLECFDACLMGSSSRISFHRLESVVKLRSLRSSSNNVS
jgi:hypothetical protein